MKMRTHSSSGTALLKLLKQLKEKITIRDILVIQDSTRLVPGEFYRHGRASESDSALLARMLLHIAKMAEQASRVHLQDNFLADKITMKPDHQNSVTRLSFNEFYFYPYHSRKCPQTGKHLGPLDEGSFS